MAGSNAGGTNTPVTVTFDSTGLAVGSYYANLCVTSDDPDPGPGNGTDLVVVPVTLTVTTAPAMMCNGPVEGFESGVPPAGWTVVNSVPGGPTWTDIPACGQAGNYTGGAGNAACMSPGSLFQQPYDAELRSPMFSLMGYSAANITYLANYQNWSGIDRLDLDISTDGGASWTNLRSWNTDHGTFQGTPGEAVWEDLAPYTGMTGLMLRWRYYWPDDQGLGWYAQIDDVRLNCTEIPPTAVTLEDLSAVPAAVSLPLAALPALATMALAAGAYVLRRRR
jgi:hypothetical protein